MNRFGGGITKNEGHGSQYQGDSDRVTFAVRGCYVRSQPRPGTPDLQHVASTNEGVNQMKTLLRLSTSESCWLDLHRQCLRAET